MWQNSIQWLKLLVFPIVEHLVANVIVYNAAFYIIVHTFLSSLPEDTILRRQIKISKDLKYFGGP